MRSRLSKTIILFLLILAVSIGTSFAGGTLCSTDCPECRVVPSCCATMADSPEHGSGKAADHLPGKTDCSHDGICRKNVQSIDMSVATGQLEYDYALVQSHLSSEVQLDLICSNFSPVPPQFPLEKVPPLYLRNCSFLI